MYMCGSLLTVDKANDVWVVEVLKYQDLAVEVFLELVIELFQIHRFYGHVTGALLEREIHISKMLSPRRCLRTECNSAKDARAGRFKGLERDTASRNS